MALLRRAKGETTNMEPPSSDGVGSHPKDMLEVSVKLTDGENMKEMAQKAMKRELKSDNSKSTDAVADKGGKREPSEAIGTL